MTTKTFCLNTPISSEIQSFTITHNDIDTDSLLYKHIIKTQEIGKILQELRGLYNPCVPFDEEKAKELKAKLKKLGYIQPLCDEEEQQLHKEISYILGTMLIQNNKIGYLKQMENAFELLPYITEYILEQCAEDGVVENVYYHTEKWIANNKDIMDKHGVPHEADYIKLGGEWLNKKDFAKVLEGCGTAEEIEEYETYTEHFSRWLQTK